MSFKSSHQLDNDSHSDELLNPKSNKASKKTKHGLILYLVYVSTEHRFVFLIAFLALRSVIDPWEGSREGPAGAACVSTQDGVGGRAVDRVEEVAGHGARQGVLLRQGRLVADPRGQTFVAAALGLVHGNLAGLLVNQGEDGVAGLAIIHQGAGLANVEVEGRHKLHDLVPQGHLRLGVQDQQ